MRMGVLRNRSARRTPSQVVSSLPKNSIQFRFRSRSLLAIGLGTAAILTLVIVAASQDRAVSTGLQNPENPDRNASATINDQASTQPSLATNQAESGANNSVDLTFTTTSNSVGGTSIVQINGTNISVPPSGTTSQTIPITSGDATVNISHTSNGDSTNISSTTTTDNVSGSSSSNSSVSMSSNVESP